MALLVAAGGVALVFGDIAEAVAILVVIVLSALIGFVTEWKAVSALAGLRKQESPLRGCGATARTVSSRQRSWSPATSCCSPSAENLRNLDVTAAEASRPRARTERAPLDAHAP